jgi:hypothetical protein
VTPGACLYRVFHPAIHRRTQGAGTIDEAEVPTGTKRLGAGPCLGGGGAIGGGAGYPSAGGGPCLGGGGAIGGGAGYPSAGGGPCLGGGGAIGGGAGYPSAGGGPCLGGGGGAIGGGAGNIEGRAERCACSPSWAAAESGAIAQHSRIDVPQCLSARSRGSTAGCPASPPRSLRPCRP